MKRWHAIIIGIVLILLGNLLLPEAKAFDDQKNDMMCMAIFKSAFEQEGVMPENIHMTKLYSRHISIFRWNLDKHATSKYDKLVFNNFVGQYMDNMDTATALQHWSRCSHRSDEIFNNYLALKG